MAGKLKFFVFTLLLLLPSFSQRPRENWVWRGIMDAATRQVSMALHQNMYISWDANVCGLFQAWQAWDGSETGGVDFTSAPHDNTSGPQPTHRGPKMYFQLAVPEEPGFNTNPTKNTAFNANLWTVNGVPAATRFLGYRFDDKHEKVTLHYWVVGGSSGIDIHETPEYIDVNGVPGLTRTFVFAGIKNGDVVNLNLNAGAWAVSGTGTLTDSTLIQNVDGSTVVLGTWP